MIHPHAIPERLGHEPELPQAGEDLMDTSSVSSLIIEVDERLHALHQHSFVLQSRQNQIPDYSQGLAPLRHNLDHALQKLIDQPGPIVWSHYFALLNRAAFLEELAYAPLVLGSQNTPKEQLRTFTDGTYGLSAHILADALEHYDNPTTTLPQQQDLRGIINELTSVALLNRDQELGHLALPAHYKADMRKTTDTIYYHRINNRPYATNIQVKSRLRPEKTPEQQTPAHGILITAEDMGNKGNFATSRAIVAELYQEPDLNLKSTSQHYLQQTHATFINQVHRKIKAENAYYPPHQATTLGMAV